MHETTLNVVIIATGSMCDNKEGKICNDLKTKGAEHEVLCGIKKPLYKVILKIHQPAVSFVMSLILMLMHHRMV